MLFTMTFVSVSDCGLQYISDVIQSFIDNKKFARIFNEQVKVNLFYVGESKDYTEKFSEIKKCILSSDMVFFDLMGADGLMSNEIDKIAKQYTKGLVLLGYGSEYLRSRTKIGSFSLGKMMKMMESKAKKIDTTNFDMEKMIKRMEKLGKFMPIGPLKDMRNMILLINYWANASYENIKSMILLLCRTYGKITCLPKHSDLVDYSKYIIFDPVNLKGYETFNEFKGKSGLNENLNTIGILYYNFNYPNYIYDILSKIITKLRTKFNVIPLGILFGSDKYEKINGLIKQGMSLDIVWDFLPFRFGAGPMGGDEKAGIKLLKKFNCPVMHPFFLSKSKICDWENNLTGLSPAEVIVYIMLPELDGIVDSIPVAGLVDKKNSKIKDLKKLQIIDDRLDKLIDRSCGYLSLKAKKNKEKKVAFIIYNYPPGEANVGAGAFLDTFKSIENITCKLKEEEYLCDRITQKELEELFMKKGIVNDSKWSVSNNFEILFTAKRYKKCNDDRLSEKMINRISSKWGDPPGKLMSLNDSFLIPGIIRKNIFVGIQPARGLLDEEDKLYHDKKMPPHHQYLAFYRWIEHEFKADAIVHVGTHGTCEFLPGKENGLSKKCFPDFFIGKMPHLYLYYTGNPSEATIAKRRTHAALISYTSPPFKRSGTYGDYAKLEELISEHIETEHLMPSKKADIIKSIKKMALDLKLVKDTDFSINNISKELIRLKTSLIPKGLHEFGKPFTDEETICFLSAILSYQRGSICSVRKIIADFINNTKHYQKTDRTNLLKTEDQINRLYEDLLKDYYFGKKDIFNNFLKKIPGSYRKKLSKAFQFGEKCLSSLNKTDEIKGLLNGLDAKYIDARLGGDFIRDPEVFPTGFNIYQFDARLVPSDTAIKRGNKIAQSTLKYFMQQNSKYPESVSVVLWGLETSKTKGETIGQILHYLGVKLSSGLDVMEKKIEIIPLKELKRPRIDCVITICGFFRDMFPLLIDLLDEIYETVSTLDEPFEMNYVKKHSYDIYNKLKDTTDDKTAFHLSFSRIFGPAQGEYGTNLTQMVESSNWKDELEFAKSYLSSQNHIYSRRLRGQSNQNVYEHNLKKVDIVSQVRSSPDYCFVDLDHYYEFFGGLAKAVESVKGLKPAMLITDSSTNDIITDDAKKAIEIGVRTRLFNPDYINEMLLHKVHGAQHIAKQVENLIGLAATTGEVDTWIFDKVKQTFIDDKTLYEKIKSNNRFSTSEIVKRLLEAYTRGYYLANKDDIKKLTETYLKLEGDIEDETA